MAGFDNEVLFSPGERLEVSSALNIQSMQQVSTDVSRVNHTGDPNLSVAANPSSLSHDPVSGFLWLKVSGTGITQWNRIFAGSNSPVFTLEGNVGGKIPPDGTGNINIVTAHSSVVFSGSGNTLTMDFLDPTFANLLLGSTVAATINPLVVQTCTSLGSSALGSITAARYNTAIGGGALQSLQTANTCTAVGASAAQNIIDGGNNTATGYNALLECVHGTNNTATGTGSLLDCTGSNNTSMGYLCLEFATACNFNLALGSGSGVNYTSTESNNILLANTGVAAESNVIRIGTAGTGAGQQSSCYIAGIYGVTVASSFPVGINANGQLSQLSATALSITSVAHAASPYTVLSTDEFLAVQSSGGAITIKLPNAPATGRVITIKDSNGAANANPISVTTVGGAVTIDGATTYTMNTNYAAINVIFDGAAYEVF